MADSFGIVYAASGDKFLEEAKLSAESCKSVMPDIDIHIWTDVECNVSDTSFDKINRLDNTTNKTIDKIAPLYNTPFKKTLFVDTDTIFLKPVYDLIPLLNRFDLAYCHAPWRVLPGNNNVLENVPAGFPEPNSGVLAYRSTPQVLDVLRKWESRYAEKLKIKNPPGGDQSSLRQVLWDSDLNTTVLPPEYNIRTIFPVFVGGNTDVKILHGRSYTLENAKKYINDKKGIRIYDFTPLTSLNARIRRKLTSMLKKSKKN